MHVKIFSLVLLIAFILLSVTGCLLFDDSDYYKGANWHYTREEFYSEYLPYMRGVIEEVKSKYNIECNSKAELHLSEYNQHVAEYLTLYFYNEEFTLYTESVLWTGSHEDVQIYLIYYGNNSDELYEYENQRYLVDFTNELIQRLCVGVEQYPDGLPFEEAFYKCIEENRSLYHENLHFDDLIGYVDFSVQIHSKGWGEYYNMSGNKDLDIICNVYKFEGILKAAPEAEGERT